MFTLLQVIVCTFLIAAFMGFVGVFVLRWATKLIDSFKTMNFYSGIKGIAALIFAFSLAKLGENIFAQYIEGVSEYSFIASGFLILAAMQAIFENYNALYKWITEVLRKKAEKEIDGISIKGK